MFRTKKLEIQRRAKRLLDAFSNESRKESLRSTVQGRRRIIRAYYENGLLVVKEDFVKTPDINRRIFDLQFQIIDDLLDIFKKNGSLRSGQ